MTPRHLGRVELASSAPRPSSRDRSHGNLAPALGRQRCSSSRTPCQTCLARTRDAPILRLWLSFHVLSSYKSALCAYKIILHHTT